VGGVRLRLRDWPGMDGPLVHVPDPLTPADDALEALARAYSPAYRVLSLTPRTASTYQVDAADLLATLDQFGFAQPIVVGERLGCAAALLVAAWHAGRVARLVLIDPTFDAPASDSIAARALRDCPPDLAALRRAILCPVLEVRKQVMDEVSAFLSG
jgi:pimeloyl-ACP methyl ester carboxylesterase